MCYKNYCSIEWDYKVDHLSEMKTLGIYWYIYVRLNHLLF